MKMTTKWLAGGVIGLLVLAVGVSFVYFEYAKRAGKESTIRSQIVSQKGNMSPASENATKLPIEKVIEGEVNSIHVCKLLYRNNGSPKGVDTLKQRKGARKETDRGSEREKCVIGGTLKKARCQGRYIIRSP